MAEEIFPARDPGLPQGYPGSPLGYGPADILPGTRKRPTPEQLAFLTYPFTYYWGMDDEGRWFYETVEKSEEYPHGSVQRQYADQRELTPQQQQDLDYFKALVNAAQPGGILYDPDMDYASPFSAENLVIAAYGLGAGAVPAAAGAVAAAGAAGTGVLGTGLTAAQLATLGSSAMSVYNVGQSFARGQQVNPTVAILSALAGGALGGLGPVASRAGKLAVSQGLKYGMQAAQGGEGPPHRLGTVPTVPTLGSSTPSLYQQGGRLDPQQAQAFATLLDMIARGGT